jgi:hypothetical protein
MPTDRAFGVTTPAEYRQFAAECLQAARGTMSAEVRATLLAMAQRSSDLAERAERNAHLRGDAGMAPKGSRKTGNSQ